MRAFPPKYLVVVVFVFAVLSVTGAGITAAAEIAPRPVAHLQGPMQ